MACENDATGFVLLVLILFVLQVRMRTPGRVAPRWHSELLFLINDPFRWPSLHS